MLQMSQNLKRGGYKDSTISIKIKKTLINPIKKDADKCFQYAATIALNHKENGKYSRQIYN